MISQATGRGDVAMEQWRRLYDAAIGIRDMAPWTWMEETDVFGVWPAGREQPAFVSVMGLLGQYHAVALYLDPREYHRFRMLECEELDEAAAFQVMDIGQLHAAFGAAKDLEAEDRRIIKELGLKFHGGTAWPYFRSYRPGYWPWYLESKETTLLTCALEQLREIAPRLQEDPDLLQGKGAIETVLVRREGADGHWSEAHHDFAPVPTTFTVEVPAALMSAIRNMEPAGRHFEVEVFPMAARIGKRGERPRRPYVLLVVDADSCYVLGVELLTVETTLEAMWATVPQHVLGAMCEAGLRPTELRVRTPWVQMVLDSVCPEVGITVTAAGRLPALDKLRRDMERRFGG